MKFIPGPLLKSHIKNSESPRLRRVRGEYFFPSSILTESSTIFRLNFTNLEIFRWIFEFGTENSFFNSASFDTKTLQGAHPTHKNLPKKRFYGFWNCVGWLNHRLLRIDPASANLSRHRPFLSFTWHFQIFGLIHIWSSQTIDRNLTIILSINSIYVTRPHLWYLLGWWIQNNKTIWHIRTINYFITYLITKHQFSRNRTKIEILNS